MARPPISSHRTRAIAALCQKLIAVAVVFSGTGLAFLRYHRQTLEADRLTSTVCQELWSLE